MRSAHPPRVAGLATASLLLLPQIAWESQRALTHSVLATTLAALSVLVFWTRLLGERRGGYLAFGVVTGLGLLAKANFAFVPVALLLAAATSAELARPAAAGGAGAERGGGRGDGRRCRWRGCWRIRSWRWGRRASSSGRGRRSATARRRCWGWGRWRRRRSGFSRCWRWSRACCAGAAAGPVARRRAPLDRFLVRLVLAGIAVVLVAVLVSEATNVKDRWLQPVLFLAAPATTVWLLGRTGDAGARWLGRTLALVAVLVVVALPVHLLTGTPGSPARGDAPLAELAAGLPGGERMLVDTAVAGGEPDAAASGLAGGGCRAGGAAVGDAGDLGLGGRSRARGAGCGGDRGAGGASAGARGGDAAGGALSVAGGGGVRALCGGAGAVRHG